MRLFSSTRMIWSTGPSPDVIRFFSVPGREVVQIEVAPVVALGVPDDLVGRPEHPPAGHRFEVRGHGFVEHGAHVACRRVSHAEHGRLVIARGRHEGQLRGVGAPRHVGEAEVVAERGAMIVRVHLEADGRARIRVDDDAVQHRDVLVAGKRVLPLLKHRVPGFCFDEVHVADLALVLLERGDLSRVGRPERDGAIASGPAGVVGGVAEVLHAVGRQRPLLAGRHVADPEVPVLDEHRALAVGRGHRGAGARAAPTAASPAAACAASSAHGRTGILARRARDVARPAPRLDIERHRLPVGGEFN